MSITKKNHKDEMFMFYFCLICLLFVAKPNKTFLRVCTKRSTFFFYSLTNISTLLYVGREIPHTAVRDNWDWDMVTLKLPTFSWYFSCLSLLKTIFFCNFRPVIIVRVVYMVLNILFIKWNEHPPRYIHTQN